MPIPNQTAAAAAPRIASRNPMGPLELSAYRADWKASRAYLRHIEEVAYRREFDAVAQAARHELMKSAGAKRPGPQRCQSRQKSWPRLRGASPFDA